MAVILKRAIPPVAYVIGSNGDAVSFSENAADALLFVDGAAATAFAVGRNIHGATQVTVSGVKNHGQKTCT